MAAGPLIGCGIFCVAVLVASIALPEWWVNEVIVGGSKVTTKAGVMTYTKTTAGSGSESGSLGDGVVGSIDDNLKLGGEIVMGLGVVVLVTAVLSLGLIYYRLVQRGSDTAARGASALLALDGVLLLLAILAYTNMIWGGYSCLLFMVATFFMLVATTCFYFSFVLSDGDSSEDEKRTTGGIVIGCISLLALMVAMGTEAWYVSATTTGGSTTTVSAGLLTYTQTVSGTGGSTSSGDLSDGFLGDLGDLLLAGGQSVLGCGVPSIIVAAIALLCVCVGPRFNKQFRLWGFGLLLIASMLAVLAVVLYADTLSAGISYMLFMGTAFGFFAMDVVFVTTDDQSAGPASPRGAV